MGMYNTYNPNACSCLHYDTQAQIHTPHTTYDTYQQIYVLYTENNTYTYKMYAEVYMQVDPSTTAVRYTLHIRWIHSRHTIFQGRAKATQTVTNTLHGSLQHNHIHTHTYENNSYILPYLTQAHTIKFMKQYKLLSTCPHILPFVMVIILHVLQMINQTILISAA